MSVAGTSFAAPLLAGGVALANRLSRELDGAKITIIDRKEIHNYQPTPRDILRARDADLVLRNGLNLELWFERFLRRLQGVPAVTLSDGIEPIGTLSDRVLELAPAESRRVDAHAELGRDYLKRGVEILLEQNADLVGGLMAARGEGAVQAAVAWSYNSRLGIGAAKYHVGGDAGEAESAYLGIFRKSALERVGGYDETIVRGEDWDLSQRIKDSGGLVWFSPELAVTYWPRESISAVAKQFYSTGVWRGDLSRRDLRRVSLR